MSYSAGFADAGRTPPPYSASQPDSSPRPHPGHDAKDGIDKLEAPNATGTINPTADEVACHAAKPFGQANRTP
ncbi:hypothetical protein [Arthrobacter pityocampae]|uniref:hypothetical protein n=1 Tax=Arthrobacter pityocampae TaxID=547334 RepID=UPI0011B02126|nr:hypothetical protein [Arthrobacter pityocampae]